MNQPYFNPYQPFYTQTPKQNMLPPQQILQANGKASIDTLCMSPNSSVLIADETAPIVWKCTSDSLGNVTAEPFDITPHKEEKQEDVFDRINSRLDRLEGVINEQSFISAYPSADEQLGSNVQNTKKRTKSAGDSKPIDAE